MSLHIGTCVFNSRDKSQDAGWNAERQNDGGRGIAPIRIAGRQLEHAADGSDRR